MADTALPAFEPIQPYAPSDPPTFDGATMANPFGNDGWENSQTYATIAFNGAIAFLNEIAGIAQTVSDLPDVSPEMGEVSTTLTPIVIPDAPVRPEGMALNLAPPPAEPVLDTVAVADLGPAPDFSAQAPVVDLAIPAPAPLSETLPVAPTLDPVALPEAFEVTLPATPTLIGLQLPDVPTLDLPTFDVALPAVPMAPDVGSFAFVEERYASALLDDLRARLLEWVDGAATGLDPAVERAIWTRAREREADANQRKLRELSRDFARRGFTKPQGALSVALSDALQEIQHRDADLSREIMVKQAELEQSNRHFAFEQAWQVESGLIQYANQIAQRAFEAARFALQIALEVFQAQAAQYEAQIKGVALQVDVFKARLQAELAKLDIFRAQIEAQKLVGEINTQLTEQYKAQLLGVQALADIYKARVEAANVIAEINKAAISAYAERVRAYGEAVRAKAAEYDGYATRVKAEVSKVDVFRAQADAYRSQVEGFSALVSAKAAEKTLELKIKQEAPIDLFKARTEAFRTQVGAESERVRALGAIYQADAQVFSARTQADSARASAEATIYRAESDVNVAEAQIRIEAAKANISKLMSQVQLLSENVRAGAQVSAQLAAAALSQINISTGTSASSSVSSSISRSDSNVNTKSDATSFSTSHNHIYNES